MIVEYGEGGFLADEPFGNVVAVWDEQVDEETGEVVIAEMSVDAVVAESGEFL